MLRIASDIPVLEDTLMRILVIGLSRELSLVSADAVELADQLIKRAAVMHLDGNFFLYSIKYLKIFMDS